MTSLPDFSSATMSSVLESKPYALLDECSTTSASSARIAALSSVATIPVSALPTNAPASTLTLSGE
ncbi:hypothetical protein A5700_00940 [Mycobacterium sp. E1214]|nr:hypothetical protein A5700_00940 [Mycobacterium sp. E1214]OBH30533.1 hypothetical protein A5693_17765 [Mycobacterium sp. E1319]